MASALVIRLAEPSDRTSLEALQRRASLANPGDRDAVLAHPDAIDLPPDQIAGGHVFVATVEGAVHGFAVVLPREDGDAELDGLFVEPDLWRGGVGRQLVEHGAQAARARGAAALHVIGNRHAAGFYTRCGFLHAGPFATRFGDADRYVRPL